MAEKRKVMHFAPRETDSMCGLNLRKYPEDRTSRYWHTTCKTCIRTRKFRRGIMRVVKHAIDRDAFNELPVVDKTVNPEIRTQLFSALKSFPKGKEYVDSLLKQKFVMQKPAEDEYPKLYQVYVCSDGLRFSTEFGENACSHANAHETDVKLHREIRKILLEYGNPTTNELEYATSAIVDLNDKLQRVIREFKGV